MDISAMIEDRGHPVVIRRQNAGTPLAFTDEIVKACWRQYGAHELVGGIVQGDYEVITSAALLAAAGFPGAPKKGDKIYLDPTIVNGAWTPNTGTPITVQHPGTRGSGIGFWIHARGGVG